QQAKDEEAAALANLGVEAAENIKQAADSGMMVASLFGGQAVDTAYQAVTGYIEGGPTEAVLRTVSSIGPRTGAAVEALRGYREGQGRRRRAASEDGGGRRRAPAARPDRLRARGEGAIRRGAQGGRGPGAGPARRPAAPRRCRQRRPSGRRAGADPEGDPRQG